MEIIAQCMVRLSKPQNSYLDTNYYLNTSDFSVLAQRPQKICRNQKIDAFKWIQKWPNGNKSYILHTSLGIDKLILDLKNLIEIMPKQINHFLIKIFTGMIIDIIKGSTFSIELIFSNLKQCNKTAFKYLQ